MSHPLPAPHNSRVLVVTDDPTDARGVTDGLRAQGLDVGNARPHRASVRVNAADTFPRVIKANDEAGHDVWIVTGLGSRGFVFAPLIGEWVASAWLGEPSPLTRAQEARLTRPL